jgi:hypothetical protein
MNGLSKWERQLRDYYSLIEIITNEREKNKGSLRFGRFFVIASDIAEQYFCEKKVEMQYLHGEIEAEAKALELKRMRNCSKTQSRSKDKTFGKRYTRISQFSR